MSVTGTDRQASRDRPEIMAVRFSIIAIIMSDYPVLELRWQHQDEHNAQGILTGFEWRSLDVAA